MRAGRSVSYSIFVIRPFITHDIFAVSSGLSQSVASGTRPRVNFFFTKKKKTGDEFVARDNAFRSLISLGPVYMEAGCPG